MAARRVTQSSINWAALAERVSPNQKPNFAAFKAKSDVYLRNVLANPETPPKIDWAFYKQNIDLAGLTEKFQQQYEALKVPYPADNVTQLVDVQEKETKSAIVQYVAQSNERIAKFQQQIAHLKSLLPYTEMTMEDYRDAFPDQALDAINRPTFWPHLPEDQPDYKPKDSISAGGGH